jgi:hypothetical protein
LPPGYSTRIGTFQELMDAAHRAMNESGDTVSFIKTLEVRVVFFYQGQPHPVGRGVSAVLHLSGP